ncbi:MULTISPECIES: restriction endonuclease subunit S [Bacillus cereus group]|uniref:restriction endonuclease subunit S n=1 Tax=Bacillus cereus group TaxID=86661 RepID=UPI0022E2F94F|nr:MULTISPECIES: restriction endonuclease subunit S [Bacillus cereus group]MDA2593497.1 restriction endonuclease subunit S [Bacillus cereus group sp. Bc065]MED2901422.1 restriction endonuclease subunit S [Bacillus tropicus]
MNVPKLRFKEFDGEWEKKNIIHIAQDEKSAVKIGPFGSQLRKEYLQSTGLYKVYGQENVFNNDFSQGNRFLNEERFNLLKSSQIISGDIVISMMGTIGKIAEVPKNIQQGIMDSHLIRIRLDNKKYLNDFFIQVMNSKILKKQIEKLSVGSIMSGLSSKVIKTLEFPHTKIEEQKKISTFLNLLDKKIQLQQQKIDLLQEQKKGFLQKMFPKAGETQPEIRFDGFAGDWEQRKLGEVANIFDGTHQTPKYTATGVKFVSVENIATLETNKFISQEAYDKEYSKKQAKKGDVLMTRIGDIGTAKVIETEESLAYYVTLALLKPNKVDSDFLVWLISSPEVKRNIWKRTLHIAFPKKINLGEINKIEMMVPNNEEQTKIGAFFKQLDDTIALHQQKITTLKEQKKGFMQQMFI